MSVADGSTVAGGTAVRIALVSHTNAGKTTLARTLLGRDVGEIRDAPHVTELAQAHLLLQTTRADRLELWDTPGFGDSARLVARLRHADNPIGWILREVWDRHRDRPLWCSQQAVRAARDSADVVLYLVNAAEDPRDAGYVAPEMQVLRWIGKPVVVLLNQVGAPRAVADEEAEVARWRAHLDPHGVVAEVLTLDAFARCWVQERVLLDALGRLLPADAQAGFARLVAAWETRATERFAASMAAIAEQLVATARDSQAVAATTANTMQRVLQSVGVGRKGGDAARDEALAALAKRLDAQIRAATDRLIALHDLDGEAAEGVLQRLAESVATRGPVDEGRAALWSCVVSGALAGLKADLASGGLTLGAGMLVGGLIGGLAGAGVARGINVWRGAEAPQVRWSDDFLVGLVVAGILRYLAVAHFGRGRGRYVEGEAPASWRIDVEGAVAQRRAVLRALLHAARTTADPGEVAGTAAGDLARELGALAAQVLRDLYPVAAVAGLLQRAQVVMGEVGAEYEPIG
ncbi:MAG TPA: DUF3482 domain-containing protein [Burkholderiaceae bacterium]|nr:DUF3482 domain-containing protein [Burkholderiaceae bacterium]